MSSEEQAEIEDFQTKEAYQTVLNKAEFYLTDVTTLLLNAGDDSEI